MAARRIVVDDIDAASRRCRRQYRSAVRRIHHHGLPLGAAGEEEMQAFVVGDATRAVTAVRPLRGDLRGPQIDNDAGCRPEMCEGLAARGVDEWRLGVAG